jgi:pyruvate/2-oxoglutarate dehydrogenase complex dihydrolipoamide acyltransferase (E2) component
MDIELVMPVLGEKIEEAQVRAWTVSEGDPVEAGDVIAVISTPKMDMDLESPATGFLKTIVVDEDEVARVGAILCIIDDDAEDEDEDTVESDNDNDKD